MNSAQASVVCVVSPNGGDAALAVQFLQERGIEARAYDSLGSLAPALDAGAGCLVVVEEALVQEELPRLREALARMPAWADVPLILVSGNVAALGQLYASAFPESGHVTLLERPLNPHSLVSAVAVALRASARQREMGELIAAREEAVRLRDEFLAMLAHELRNPLAPMKNVVQLLRMQPAADEHARRCTDVLDRQVSHMVRMVDDLMDVARLERGKVALRMQRVDLNRVTAAAVESCQPSAEERGRSVTLRLASEPLAVDADPVRIEQMVCNLVNNAVKFSPASAEIVIYTAAEGGNALVSVEDPGVGFEQGVAENLFKPFLQANPTLDRSAGGLGIGLTIVRRLAELHGGSVRAASDGPGRGARFVVRLPLAQGLPRAAFRDAAPAPAHRRRRVVVIEDNKDIRDTLRTLLTRWGHDVTTAADGRAGLDCVLESRPDVALVDVGLPEMNGYDVARTIRSRLPGDGIRLIAITGYGQPADRERARQAGFDEHLLKPVEPEVLAREVLR